VNDETMPACIYCTGEGHWSQECSNLALCGPLCGATASRDRVCAAPASHTGAHVFVLQTERED